MSTEIDIQIHDMASVPSDKLWSYLDSGNQLKVIVENRPWEEVTSRSLLRFRPRMVFVCPKVFPGISTDQNANAWVNGEEFMDIIVTGELSDKFPAVLRALAKAVKEAADANPLA